jgi:hypothetical protein
MTGEQLEKVLKINHNSEIFFQVADLTIPVIGINHINGVIVLQGGCVCNNTAEKIKPYECKRGGKW